MGLHELAAEAAERECATNPRDGTAWARLGALRLRLLQPEAAKEALTRSRRLPELTVDVLLDLALANHLLEEPVSALECVRAAAKLDDSDVHVWTALAHALDRTGAISECVIACENALTLGANPVEMGELRARKLREQPAEIDRVA
jgi:tetratricopeptide (TPR) repeat protein